MEVMQEASSPTPLSTTDSPSAFAVTFECPNTRPVNTTPHCYYRHRKLTLAIVLSTEKMILLCLFSLFAALSSTQSYHLVNSYPGATFLDNFDFFTSWDPTFGYIHYVDRLTAEQRGMITYTPNTTRWGVESTEVLDPSANLGRLSLRLTSKQSWTHGLFIVDLAHMPHNSCGAWPAYWTVGSGVWPSTGEPSFRHFRSRGCH